MQFDDLFDQFQSIVRGGLVWKSGMRHLIEQAYRLDEARYREVWLPYLATVELPLFEVETVKAFEELRLMLPTSARFRGHLSDEFEHENVLRALDIAGDRFTDLSVTDYCDLAALETLLGHPAMEKIKSLRLCGIGDYWDAEECVELLSNSARLSSLQALSFVVNHEFEDRHCELLASATNLTGLTTLRFEGQNDMDDYAMTSISDEGVQTLIRAFRALQILDLSSCHHVTSDGLSDLESLNRLRAISVGMGVSGSPSWIDSIGKQITHLDLSDSNVDPTSLAGECPNLRCLLLARNPFAEAVLELATVPAFPELRHLGFFDWIDWDFADQGGPEPLPINEQAIQQFLDVSPEWFDDEGFEANSNYTQLRFVSYMDSYDFYPQAIRRGAAGTEWSDDVSELTSGMEPRFIVP